MILAHDLDLVDRLLGNLEPKEDDRTHRQNPDDNRNE